jgi:4-hydroxyphenylpyruvate dioxygenase
MADEKNPLGLKKIHHVEFYVGNAKQAEFFYRKAFGFSRAAYSGLETGNRETTSYVMRQNRVTFRPRNTLSSTGTASATSRFRSMTPMSRSARR